MSSSFACSKLPILVHCSECKARDHSMSTLHQVWKCRIFFKFFSQGLGAELFLGEPSVPYTNFPNLLLGKQGEKQPLHVLLEHKRKYKDSYPQTITSSCQRHLIVKKEIEVGCEIIYTLECAHRLNGHFQPTGFWGHMLWVYRLQVRKQRNIHARCSEALETISWFMQST